MQRLPQSDSSDKVEEVHHDLSVVPSHPSHDSSDDEDGDKGPAHSHTSARSSIIGRLRQTGSGDAKFHRLPQLNGGDDNDDTFDNEEASSRRTAASAGASSASSAPISPRIGAFSNSSSFDDELDMEYGINRYNVADGRGRVGNRNGRSSRRQLERKASTASSLGGRIAAPFIGIVDSLKSARANARRKRAEQLLAMNEEGRMNRTRISVCFSNWCDMSVSNRGVLLVVLAIAAFVAAYKLLDEEENKELRRGLLMIGIPLIVLRFTWKYIFWVLCERRKERRRKITMDVFGTLNGEHGTGGIEIPGMHDDDDYSVASSLVLSAVNSHDAEDISIS